MTTLYSCRLCCTAFDCALIACCIAVDCAAISDARHSTPLVFAVKVSTAYDVRLSRVLFKSRLGCTALDCAVQARLWCTALDCAVQVSTVMYGFLVVSTVMYAMSSRLCKQLSTAFVVQVLRLLTVLYSSRLQCCTALDYSAVQL